MFEVGKKYRSTTGLIVTCVASYSNDKYHYMLGDVIESSGDFWKGSVEKFSMSHGGKNWSEYQEPVVKEYIKSVNVNSNGNFYTFYENAELHNQVGKVKFTVTDGKLTGVAII